MFLLLLSSCSITDYTSVVPCNSISVAVIDLQEMPSSQSLLKELLTTDDITTVGLSTDEPAYMFTTPEGYFCMTMPISDNKTLMERIENCTAMKERDGIKFSLLKGGWLTALKSSTFVVLGQVSTSDQTRAQRYIMRLFKLDEKHSFSASPLSTRLDSIDSPCRMVATVASMPEQMRALLMLGAPKNADESQIAFAAALNLSDSTLVFDSKPFALNEQIDKELQAALSSLHPITNRLSCTSSIVSINLNMNGEEFLPIMKADRPLLLVLSQIDGDSHSTTDLLQSTDGDMAIEVLRNANGAMTTILRAYDKQGRLITQPSRSSLPTMVTTPPSSPRIAGKRIGAHININSLSEEVRQLIETYTTPRFGRVNGIVYVVK